MSWQEWCLASGHIGCCAHFTEVYNSVCPHRWASFNPTIHWVLAHFAALGFSVSCSALFCYMFPLQNLAGFLSSNCNLWSLYSTDSISELRYSILDSTRTLFQLGQYHCLPFFRGQRSLPGWPLYKTVGHEAPTTTNTHFSLDSIILSLPYEGALWYIQDFTACWHYLKVTLIKNSCFYFILSPLFFDNLKDLV